MRIKAFHSYSLNLAIIVTIIIFFISSSLRHLMFRSTGYDLGIFDQVLYLISQGQSSFSSILDFHILGDHAAFIFYVLAFFYKIYPSVYWLFAIQAISLAIGAIPTKYLALNAGLKESQANTIALAYLLYPVVFNLNLFDFHPDVFALPAFIWAILAARVGSLWQFGAAIVLILSCKAVFSLTVAAMGFWLLIFEKKRLYGNLAIGLGVAWFLVATKIIIPFFGQNNADLSRHLVRYANLGTSFPDVINNLIHHPQIFLAAIFNLPNITYLIALFFPLAIVLAPQDLTPLVSAIPAFAMNLLSSDVSQKDVIHQYSLPILPFLLVAAISTIANGRGFFKTNRAILIWSFGAFIILSNFFHFDRLYFNSLDTWEASNSAIAQISPQDNVIATNNFAPHLTHRKIVKLPTEDLAISNLDKFKYILLNLRRPGFMSSPEIIQTFLNRLEKMPEFKLKFKRDEVFLFEKIDSKRSNN
jgi:uncharacterized membrane protein